MYTNYVYVFVIYWVNIIYDFTLFNYRFMDLMVTYLRCALLKLPDLG